MLGYVSVVFMIYCANNGFVEVFESQLLTETFRGSAQARPKQALHVTSYTITLVWGSRRLAPLMLKHLL